MRRSLIAFLAFALLACPLAWASQASPRQAYAAQPFYTVRPQPATFQAVFTATPPLPTPLLTLGPGQYFEEADSNRPEVGEVHGNDDFGWGKVRGQPGLILMWVTDHEGTHYVTVEETSDLFLGTPDPATNSRLEDGFDDYIGQMDIIQRQRVATGAEGIASGAAIAVLAWGIGLCPATGGGGCVAGVVGAIAVAVGNAVRDHIILAGLNGELRTLQSSASDVFDDALAAGQP